MPWYEIQYETGNMSVAEYADDAEAQAALKAHHDRAVKGEQGGPEGTNWPAERIAKVYVYESKHPDEYNPEQTMTADVAAKETAAAAKGLADTNGVLNVQDLAAAVAGLSHPFVVSRQPFESSYKMKADRELALEGSES
jgi:hypothetical protein